MSTCNSCPECDPGVSDQNIVRNRLDFTPWEDRFERMITNQYGVRDYLYSVSPFSKQFMVHPPLNDSTVLVVAWDGLKMDFADSDVVPWPEHAAEAIAAYVKSFILRTVDKRPDLAQVEYGAYIQKRLQLWREQNEARVADGRDEEYDVTAIPNPTPLQGFGAQLIPFLSTVTQLVGTDSTALAAVPTVSITPNYAVQFLNATALIVETWVLKAGTDADDPTSGVLRPNDYIAAENEKVWLRQ